MRTSASAVALFAAAAVLAAACSHAPPPPPPLPPVPLSDSEQAAVRWVDAHAVSFSASDSTEPTADDRARLTAFMGDARILGISELTETTHEITTLVRRTLFTLAESDNVHGLAVQAPMAEAMEVDRWVRTRSTTGDPRRLLHALGSWRWETHDMVLLVTAMRDWNSSHGPDKQIGFYGFEIPTGAHAVQVITGLRDSVTGPVLGPWLRRQYGCVISDEDAHWGLEGRAADSSFWNGCRPTVTAAADSLAALRARLNPSSRAAADVAFAEQMGRLIQHHVTIGLRHLARQDGNAEHVIYLANALGPDAKLVVWGGDAEMGRITLLPSTVQTGVALGTRLGAKYRAVGFMVGDGSVRIHRPSNNGRGGVGGQSNNLSDVTLRLPARETFEDVFRRAAPNAYWLDMRDLPKDIAGAWLHGPRSARLVIDVYAPELPELFLTPIEFPKELDGILFVKHVTPARQ